MFEQQGTLVDQQLVVLAWFDVEPRSEPVTAAPPPAQPDDKDWTWVLERECPDCEVQVGHLTMPEIAALNRRCADSFAEVLRRDETWVKARPQPDVWSPLEYGCHVRDVFRLFAERLELMLDQDDPEFANWNPNDTAEAERYDLQDPAQVATELLSAAGHLADCFESLDADQLRRSGRRSDGASFTVETFARYEIHDPLHHLWDVIGAPMSDWTS